MPYKDPEKRKTYHKKWRGRNREKLKEYWRLWRKKNPERANAICRKYRATHKKERYIACTKWKKNNPEKERKIHRHFNRKKRKTPKGNLDHRMEVSIRNSLKEMKKGRRWEDLVGYTVEELKEHLEKQFKNRMNWERFLKGEIEIDHIKPKSLFNYTSPNDLEFKQCWALENLQLLEKIKNIKKSNRLINF
ncbi:hypothetical protein KJA15_04165 [Patescibacteria group bacterium]|nr:hypothetical protein [Patescibacteria group bacterium]